MKKQRPLDLPIGGWLTALGVERLNQWDALVFLYRHQTSLVSAEHIARLLGYATSEIIAALDYLEPLGFVKRSRVVRGVRLYRFATPEMPHRNDALNRILALAHSRAGRLLLAKKLRHGNPTNPNNGEFRAHCEEGEAAWRKAI